MSKLTQEHKKFLADVDAYLSLTEMAADLAESSHEQINYNPLSFLMVIINKFAKKDEIIDMLTKFLVVELPVIEYGVKGILLSRLKSQIDCNENPLIPNSLRKEPFNGQIVEIDKGIDVNVSDIDLLNIFTYSPLSTEGKSFYFGTSTSYDVTDNDNNVHKFTTYKKALKYCSKKRIPPSSIFVDHNSTRNVYSLVRAEDFNAFLWFVMHKTRLQSPSIISDGTMEDFVESLDNGSTVIDINGDNENVKHTTLAKFGVVQELKGLTTTPKPTKYFNNGQTFCNGGSNIISIVYDSYELIDYPKTRKEINDDLLTHTNYTPFMTEHEKEVALESLYMDYYWNRDRSYVCKFAPISDNNFSINWYIKDNFFSKSKQEKPICNIQYMGISNDNTITDAQDKFKILVLPKPFKVPPLVASFIPLPITCTFDCNGNPDTHGYFSVKPSDYDFERGDDRIIYHLTNGRDNQPPCNLVIESTMRYYLSAETTDVMISYLYESYPPETIYQFNYDFVMGMKLFDATQVISQLLATLTAPNNPHVGMTFTYNETEYKARIAYIIKKMLEKDVYNLDECFYTFSNDEYAEMLAESEIKRANGYSFIDSERRAAKIDINAINDILGEIDSNATQEKIESVYKRAITEACVQISEEADPKDVYTIELNFIKDIITNVVGILVEAIVSPKLLLLMEVNRKLVVNQEEDDNPNLIEKIFNEIVSIVAIEIRDLYIEFITNWIASKINKMLLNVEVMLAKEQTEYYLRLISQLLDFYKRNRKRFNYEVGTDIENVDYADIDNVDIPITNNC